MNATQKQKQINFVVLIIGYTKQASQLASEHEQEREPNEFHFVALFWLEKVLLCNLFAVISFVLQNLIEIEKEISSLSLFLARSLTL